MREILEKDKVNIDDYLYHYINAQTYAQETRKRVDRLKPEKTLFPPVPEKYMFQVYEETIKNNQHSGDFLNDLKKNADNYIDFVNPKDSVSLRGLREMRITKCYPLLIRGKMVLNKKNFDSLSHALECISFRHSIMRLDPKELESFYYGILDKLTSDNSLPEVIDDIKRHATITNARFKSSFSDASPSENVSKYILQRIINHLKEEINFKSRAVWLEHIMPQKPKGEWLELQKLYGVDLYDDCVRRLGNLTYLKDKKNIVASNSNFNEKKKIYSTSNIQMTRDIALHTVWDGDAITNRQKELSEIAEVIWSL